jgi:probable rRNA maturation factor
MSRTLAFRNRQRVRRIDTALLRRITLHVLREQFQIADFEVAIHLVAAPEMARVNKAFLNHEGSTDVITFDHSEEACPKLHGEIFLCLDDAVKQATQFRTSWQSEVVRYVIHGLLHLCGHDDLKPAARRVMKREENRLLREIGTQFPLGQLECQKLKRGANTSAARRIRSAN